ncbi:MAG: permease prefix domain 1-containing protein [Acidobacteriaceae bacterium]
MAWLRRLRSLFRRDALAREYDEELRFHLAMREERNLGEGMAAAEARRRARLRFGNPAVWRERLSEVDLLLLPLSIWQDVRFGARMLVRNWSFTLVAVFALALGIGINTAAFTAYQAFFARKIDARHPEQIVNLALILHNGETSSLFSYPDYVAYREGLHACSGVIATGLPQLLTLKTTGGVALAESQGNGTLIGKLGWLPTTGTGERADAMVVSENFFSVLGVAAIRGRTFQAGDKAALERARRAHQRELLAETISRRSGDCGKVCAAERGRLHHHGRNAAQLRGHVCGGS